MDIDLDIRPWFGNPNMNHVLNDAYRYTVEARIGELWRYRSWYRTHRWADWPDLRKEVEVELRCLVGVARRARAMAAAVERSNAAGEWYAGMPR